MTTQSMMTVALDTNVIVATRRSRSGDSNALLRALRAGQIEAVASVPMILEYEMVLDAAVNSAANAIVTFIINVVVAEKLAALRTEQYFKDRAQRADLSDFDELLETAGDEPPCPSDEILPD